jgi:dienelactone hydrolase
MMIREVADRGIAAALGAWFLFGTACGDGAVPSLSIEETQLGEAQAPITAGACCSDGDCLCQEDVVNETTATRNGPFTVRTFTVDGGNEYGGGTVFFPSNATGPFSAFVMCPGFTARQSSIRDWGPFFASHGIVIMTMDTSSTRDPVNARDDQLLAALDDLRAENARRGGPLFGALDVSRLGVAGWSMGGGGAWLAGQSTPALKSVISMAGHHRTAGGARVVASNLRVPTLMLAGSADSRTLGGGQQSQQVFEIMSADTPKMLYEVQGAGHFVWGTPRTNGGAVGRYALSWQKFFLDGDERFLAFLQEEGPNASDFRSNL